jgi:hypothetical protein
MQGKRVRAAFVSIAPQAASQVLRSAVFTV